MRVKRGTVSRRKHNKLHKLTKGYRGTKKRLIRAAKEASLHAGAYAFHGRKRKKRDIRSLWMVRISEACKQNGVSYSVFINKMKANKIDLDRKIFSDLVANDPQAFQHIIDSVK